MDGINENCKMVMVLMTARWKRFKSDSFELAGKKNVS